MATLNNITRKRGDNRRHVWTIKDKRGIIVPVNDWTAFSLTVDPNEFPVDNTANVDVISGALVSDGLDGKIYFTPSKTVPVGDYFYDAQAIDGNGETFTFSDGTYTVVQDRDKT